LCVHGHFYQPPRENPWVDEIDIQGDAAPFHDWNERIFFECYLPNANARIADEAGRILKIVNNYKGMSFNFGPTLMSWLERKHPGTYQKILDADRESVKQHRGHGNAIAQAYNHIILPLANERDKFTQVRWGVREFQYRFRRRPESIWLAETACNVETLNVLIEEKINYIILAPHQAESVRAMNGDGGWEDVSDGSIDPKMAYRYYADETHEKYIDIFFYDGPISKDLGFGDLAFDAGHMMARLSGAVNPGHAGNQLIHISTDGETYGHHKAYGERALAYVLTVEAEKQGFRVVNYGEYLEENKPTHEVRIKPGPNGEGTSWSCAHGLGRWKDNCGCRGGGPGHWTQEWRKPLREALDWLRDETSLIYEKQGNLFFKDAWAAREDYIDVILNRNPATLRRFFEAHAVRELDLLEQVQCLKLLELQRYAMLMYTSCGWFFTELSGIETVQIMLYAAQVIQFAEELSARHIEAQFLKFLEKAPSNIEQFKNGRGVYDALVRPVVFPMDKVVARFGITSIFEAYDENFCYEIYDLKVLNRRMESYGNLTLNFGRVQIRSRVTLEERDLVFIVLQIGGYDFRCSVRSFTDLTELMSALEEIEQVLFKALHAEHVVELLRKVDHYFGAKYYALKDLFRGDRIRIISRLTKDSINEISEVYDRLFDRLPHSPRLANPGVLCRDQVHPQAEPPCRR